MNVLCCADTKWFSAPLVCRALDHFLCRPQYSLGNCCNTQQLCLHKAPPDKNPTWFINHDHVSTNRGFLKKIRLSQEIPIRMFLPSMNIHGFWITLLNWWYNPKSRYIQSVVIVIFEIWYLLSSILTYVVRYSCVATLRQCQNKRYILKVFTAKNHHD